MVTSQDGEPLQGLGFGVLWDRAAIHTGHSQWEVVTPTSFQQHHRQVALSHRLCSLEEIRLGLILLVLVSQNQIWLEL